MKTSLLAALLIFSGNLSVFAQSWYPTQFEIKHLYESVAGMAETIYHIGDKKIFMYRLVGGEKTMMTLTDLASARPKSIILYPDSKQYLIAYLDEPDNKSLWAGAVPVEDPRHPCSNGYWQCEMQGTEQLNGRTADRWEMTTQDKVTSTAWIDRELKFPIRIENEDGSAHQLVDLSVRAQPESLFVLPDGYEEMTF